MTRTNPTIGSERYEWLRVGVDALIAAPFRMIQRVESPNGGAVIQKFADTFLQVCEGRGLDLLPEGGKSVPDELHRRMVEKKTARLIQAHDDLLDAVGREEVMGKPAGIDARNGKQTYLTPAQATVGTSRDRARGPLRAARQVVAHYTAAACTFPDSLSASPSREMLRTLAVSLADRRC